MNIIDKNNVEAFYLDYLEGTLSQKDTDSLLSYIDSNPDIAELFEDSEDILSIQVKPSQESFGDTADLKTLPCDDDEICLANIDYWLIAKTENTLSADVVTAVDEFVKANKLENTESFISAAYLKPNFSETFGNVAVLKKQGGTIIPLMVRLTSIAAIFIFIWLMWNPNKAIAPNYKARINVEKGIKIPNYISPEIAIPLNTYAIKENSKDRKLKTDEFKVQNNTETKKIEKTEQKLDLFKSSFPSISKSNEIAFNNPPIILEEDFNISAMFSDFEETIAANKNVELNNDFASIKSNTNSYKLEEQYRPVTSRLSNLTRLDMSYKKMPEAADVSQTVIQIGKFSFDRKKNK